MKPLRAAARSADVNAAAIDGTGHVLGPCPVQSHGHVTWAATPPADHQHSLAGYEQVIPTAQARNMLMRGVEF